MLVVFPVNSRKAATNATVKAPEEPKPEKVKKDIDLNLKEVKSNDGKDNKRTKKERKKI